jgi:hypothetical protein
MSSLAVVDMKEAIGGKIERSERGDKSQMKGAEVLGNSARDLIQVTFLR